MLDFPDGPVVKIHLPGRRCKRHGFDPWIRKIPSGRKWQCTQEFLPGKFHGQKSLAGYSPWCYKESDTAKQMHHTCRWYVNPKLPIYPSPLPLLVIYFKYIMTFFFQLYFNKPGKKTRKLLSKVKKKKKNT